MRGILLLALSLFLSIALSHSAQAFSLDTGVRWCVESSPCPAEEAGGDVGGGRYPPPIEEHTFLTLFSDYSFILWIVIAIAGVIIVVWSLPNREIKIWGDKAREIPFLILKRRKKRRRRRP